MLPLGGNVLVNKKMFVMYCHCIYDTVNVTWFYSVILSPENNFSEAIVTFGSLSLSFLPMSSSPGLMPVTECGVVR